MQLLLFNFVGKGRGNFMPGAEGKKGGTVTEALEKSKGAQQGRAMVEGGERKEKKRKENSCKIVKPTTAGISHSPSAIRIAQCRLDLRRKLHFRNGC